MIEDVFTGGVDIESAVRGGILIRSFLAQNQCPVRAVLDELAVIDDHVAIKVFGDQIAVQCLAGRCRPVDVDELHSTSFPAVIGLP